MLWKSETVYTTYLSFAKASHTQETLVVINGHNTRNNRTCNSNLATVIDKFEKDIGIIKQLSDNQISSRINLWSKEILAQKLTNT